MKDAVVIRPAHAADDLAAMWEEIYRRQHVPLLPAGARVPFMPRGQAYVALIDDRVAGFCCIDAPCLSELWVNVDCQRRGVGSSLIRFAEGQLREAGVDEATLTVLAVNRPAIAFYERTGWRRDPEGLPSVTGQGFLRFRKRLS